MELLTLEVERCGWCGHLKEKPGWHDCEQAAKGRKELADILVAINDTMRGGKEIYDNGRPPWAKRSK